MLCPLAGLLCDKFTNKVIFNERTDSMAKQALSRHSDVSEEPLTLLDAGIEASACARKSTTSTSTGRVTYEMIPVVG